MARKRKIPVRKHHGIRDPLKQQEQKEKKLSKVTNNPPVKKDEQQVSFKFRQFKQLADATKTGKKVKLGQIGREDKPKSITGVKASGSAKETRNIKQFTNETDEDYLRRVNRITSASVREAHYEAKYGVNVIRNPKTGEITVQKRPKNEIDELLKQKQKERRLAGQKGRKKVHTPQKPTMDAKTSRELVKRAYREAQQEVDTENKQNAGPTEYKHDVVAFGEIVHAPPSLKILPRKAAKNETVPRPGRKTNLLLKSMLDPAETQSNEETQDSISRAKVAGKSKTAFKPPTKAQMKGKRKDLPLATRSMLESERSKMVLLYRQLKNKTTADA
ncbi:coiled-coil domain-containing protein 137 [Drosophila ficusphila]|uniref:coiled-coil domain-containing protein 137 n=1 Tax=Drosophila ficusphila TaxID=30025 RepID=UPI0007E5E0F6|nr:coiled-coil domain-containing protein 137 [Drosophila ficusphila]